MTHRVLLFIMPCLQYLLPVLYLFSFERSHFLVTPPAALLHAPHPHPPSPLTPLPPLLLRGTVLQERSAHGGVQKENSLGGTNYSGAPRPPTSQGLQAPSGPSALTRRASQNSVGPSPALPGVGANGRPPIAPHQHHHPLPPQSFDPSLQALEVLHTFEK